MKSDKAEAIEHEQPTRDLLHAAGLRATAPRQAVLELLLSASRPLSHSEVVEHLGTELWDQATLYRNLIKLVEVGIARVASEVGGVRRYEASARQGGHAANVHPHFVCTACGGVTCLPGVRLVADTPQSAPAVFQQPALEIQVHGRCDTCVSEA